MRRPRLRTWLALLLYVGIGLGSPVLDASLSHGDGATRAAHVESANEPGCHHEECVLDAPGAPQAPAGSPVTASLLVALRIAPPRPFPQDPDHDRTPARPLGARAPPV